MRIRWRGLELPSRVVCNREKLTDTYGEFYVEPWGWLPADPTYGFERSDDPAVRDFHLGHLPAYRMIVNLDYGSELHPPKHSLRSEPLDFQRGEVEIDGKNLYYPHWDCDMQIEWLDEGP